MEDRQMNIDLEAKLAVLNALTPNELEREYERVIGQMSQTDRAAMIDRILTAPKRQPEPDEQTD